MVDPKSMSNIDRILALHRAWELVRQVEQSLLIENNPHPAPANNIWCGTEYVRESKNRIHNMMVGFHTETPVRKHM